MLICSYFPFLRLSNKVLLINCLIKKVFLLITKTELPPEKYPPEEEMSGEQKVLKHLGIKENLELDKI